MTRFAPFGKKAVSLRRSDRNRPRASAPRTHAPFKFQWRPHPSWLFVYPPRNPSQKTVRAPRYAYAGASIILEPIHDKRRAVLKRKPRRRARKSVRAKRVRFSRNTKRK